MYILSMKQINTKEDLFFSDVASPEQREAMKQFNQFLYETHKSSFYTRKTETYKERDEHGNYVFTVKVSIFKTIEQARKYFNSSINSLEPIRLQTRDWNQAHKILTKVEIINNIDGTISKQLSNCLENTCERFGGKCDENNGCSTVTFAKEYKSKIFPIKVISVSGAPDRT